MLEVPKSCPGRVIAFYREKISLFGTDPQKKSQHDDFNLDMRIMQKY